ncbi:MAG TPA: hypothetical protein VK590_01800 [Saprospiraceae bacterium]|nr:hypothetical protein [Saprospiraceae bacterium]
MNKDKFIIELITPDMKLVRKIARNRPHLKKQDIQEMLMYNIVTSGQLSSLTGKRSNVIITMTSLQIKNTKPFCKLTRVLPFLEVDENGDHKENTKKTFILMDEKAMKFLYDNNK